MAEPRVFHGTSKEAEALRLAIGKNCECTFNPEGGLIGVACPAHQLMHDQRAMDGLLFARRIRDCLQREEQRG